MKHGRCGSEACRLERTSFEVKSKDWMGWFEGKSGTREPICVYPLKPILEKNRSSQIRHLHQNRWQKPVDHPSPSTQKPVLCSLKILPATMQNFTSRRFKGVGQALHKLARIESMYIYIYIHMCLSYLYSHLKLYTCVWSYVYIII